MPISEPNMITYLRNIVIISLALTSVTAATIIQVPQDQPTIQAGIDAASEEDTVLTEENSQEPSYWDKIKKKFEDLESENKELREIAKEWIKEDIEKIGDWEYKVVNLEYESIDELENKLNELGNERWECFWVEKKEEVVVFILKRPKTSYLQKIPKGDLLKMLKKSQEELRPTDQLTRMCVSRVFPRLEGVSCCTRLCGL